MVAERDGFVRPRVPRLVGKISDAPRSRQLQPQPWVSKTAVYRSLGEWVFSGSAQPGSRFPCSCRSRVRSFARVIRGVGLRRTFVLQLLRPPARLRRCPWRCPGGGPGAQAVAPLVSRLVSVWLPPVVCRPPGRSPAGVLACACVRVHACDRSGGRRPKAGGCLRKVPPWMDVRVMVRGCARVITLSIVIST